MTEKVYLQDIQNARINETEEQLSSNPYSKQYIQSLGKKNEAHPGPRIWKWVALMIVGAIISSIIILLGISPNKIKVESSKSILPPILWILTPRDINHSRMQPTFYAYHMQHIAQKSGFETRFVDHESAYRWLSEPIKDIITKAMHRRKYEFSVEEFLRIALIIENGGVILRIGSAFLIQELNWIQNIFSRLSPKGNQNYLLCPLNNSSPQLFMFSKKDIYSDVFIAAQRNSSLLWRIFLQMAEAVQQKRETPSLKNIQTVNEDTNSISLAKPFQFLLNAHLSNGSTSACQQWALQSIDITNSSIDKINQCSFNLTQFVKEKDRKSIINQCGLNYMIDIQGVEYEMSDIFKMALERGPNSIENYHKSSLIAEYFLQLEPLQRYIKPLDRIRSINFCIISLKTVPKFQAQKKIQYSLKRLRMQNFPDWTAIYFVQQKAEVLTMELNATVLTASIYEGLNLQTAVTQHCPHGSIVFLLDFDESFTSSDNLAETSQLLSERSIYGGLVPLQINSSKKAPPQIRNIKRVQFSPNVENLNTITNHFRVFNSDYYSLISHTDLHNVEGEYFDRAIPFLGMLEMAQNMGRCHRSDQIFEIKRMRQKIDFPEKLIVLPFHITANIYKTVDSRKPEYNIKFNYSPFCEVLSLKKQNDNWSWNGEEIIVRNLGLKYQSPTDRRDLPKIIPRKIHQIWIEGQPSQTKKALMNQIKRLHPQFEYLLWSMANITREKFPFTYNILQNVLQFNKVSPYNKYAMVADLMRIEIIYQQGGFYFDTNYLWFGKVSLQDWRTYEMVIAGQLYPKFFIVTSSSPFGSYARNPRLLRLLKPEVLSRVNIFVRSVWLSSGPGFIKRLIQGSIEESDVNILRPSMEQLMPFFPFYGMTHNNFCRKDHVTGMNADFMFIEMGWGFYKNCSKLYPSSYGTDIFEIGGSWIIRKQS